MCLETVYSILGYWNYPLTNILGDTGCHIANLLRVTGGLEAQFHSFIMATTRYIFLFHDNLLQRFNLTTNVSAITYSLHCTKQRQSLFSFSGVPLHCTLDLLALIPFKLQHSQLVSLWKFSHCGYKKWYCHFYSCQINKSDIWLQFEKNEKTRQMALSCRKIKNKS